MTPEKWPEDDLGQDLDTAYEAIEVDSETIKDACPHENITPYGDEEDWECDDCHHISVAPEPYEVERDRKDMENA